MEISRLAAAPLKNPSGKTVDVPEARHSAHEKQNYDKAGSSQLLIEKPSQKRTGKDRDQYINTKLSYHCQGLIHTSIIFQRVSPPPDSQDRYSMLVHTACTYVLDYTHFFSGCLGKS